MSRPGGGAGGGSRGVGGRGGWANALTEIAKTKDPVSDNVPEGTILVDHDRHTITIEDKWPKSTFHYLVLPRIPFILSAAGSAQVKARGVTAAAPPKLSLAGGKLSGGTSTSGDTVPATHLQSLSALLASPYAAEVLTALRTAGDRAFEKIHARMRDHVPSGSQKRQVTWSVERAFHAIPSMETVHLHVYSVDLVSAPLKNAKHYNSFRPGHGFALPLSEVAALVRSGTKTLPEPTSYYAALLKAPLIGRDGKQYRNIPQLKQHLEEFLQAELESAGRESQQGECSGSAGSVRSASPFADDNRKSKRRRTDSREEDNTP